MTRILALLAAALALAGAAAAEELPARAPGLWETRWLVDGKPKLERACVGPNDRAAFLFAFAKEGCTREAQKLGDAWMVESRCRIKGLDVAGKMRIVGDFETFARAELVTTVTDATGALAAPRALTTFDARRVGDCPPSAK